MSKSYKWLLIGMLSCAFFFHQADRALFGLLTIPIQKDIGLTDVQIGWINTTLSWTLAAASAYGVFRGFFEVNTHASLFDVVSPEHRSAAVGLLNMIAFFFGGLSGVVMGSLSQKWGVRGFEIGFGVMAAAYAAGALLMAYSFFFTFSKNRITE